MNVYIDEDAEAKEFLLHLNWVEKAWIISIP